MKPSLRIGKLVLWVWVMTIVFGVIYASGQYIIRSDANDPQIQLTEDATNKINNGGTPESVVPSGAAIDLRNSLSPYVIVYDENGKQLASNARLDNSTVDVPYGVLQHAENNSDNRVTWEPDDGVRSAIVVKHFSSAANSGFVVVGRSLRETEKRENQLMILCGLGWALTIIPLSVYVWLANEPLPSSKPKKLSRKK